MHIDHSTFFHRTGQLIRIISEFYAVLFDDIAGSADGSRAIVAMFGNMISFLLYTSDCVLINASFAIQAMEPAKPIEECVAIARESLESGKALNTLKKFVELNS